MDESVEKLRDFVNGSATFNSFVFQGLYSMPTDDFLVMFSHYIKTGENKLDEYSGMMGTIGESNSYGRNGEFEYFDYDKREKIKNWLGGKSFWDFKTFADENRISEIKRSITLSEAEDLYCESYKARRRRACAHTSKTDVRERIFKKHGRKCVECGTSEQLEIDHIVPVVKGGGDEDENLRPLCKSCNSSKGCK